MRLTSDESRALRFIAGLLFLSAAVRFAALPEPVPPPASAGFDLDAHIGAVERAVADGERRSRPLGAGERIDPNTADPAELDRLPGVGAALADRIVAARTDGRFRSPADLTRVPGIGPRTAERLAPHLSLPRTRPDVGVPRPTTTPDRGDGPDPRRGATPTSPMSGGERRGGAPMSGVGLGGGAEGPVDLNAADVSELVTLPGVGPVLARRIVAYRDSAGPFVAVDSLLHVKGIGAATLERLRSRVRVRR